jgi:AcrR family transcriptional regulator
MEISVAALAERRNAQRAPARPRRSRLDAVAWIEAAFEALARDGFDAVRVEPLAQALGVTKGSFYWHFADRDALLAALFARWAEGRVAAIRAETNSGADARATLYRLIELYARGPNTRGLAIELAIRGLARCDARAAAAVNAVDAERLARVAALFEGLGHKAANAEARAFLFYAFVFGQSLIARRSDVALRTAAADLFLR